MNNLFRRRLIKQMAFAGIAACAAAFLSTSMSAIAAGSLIPIGKTDDFLAGTYKKVVLSGGESIYVTKTSDGFRALSCLCPRDTCQVLWVRTQKRFKCPCGGEIYDERGASVGGSAKKASLASFKTSTENGTVYIEE